MIPVSGHANVCCMNKNKYGQVLPDKKKKEKKTVLLQRVLLKETYSDQEAVQIHGLAAALLPVTAIPAASTTEDLGQAPSVVDPQNVDVVLAAERLDEGEVDLQGHVFDVLVVGGQDAHDHVIRVPVGGGKDWIFKNEWLTCDLHTVSWGGRGGGGGGGGALTR